MSDSVAKQNNVFPSNQTMSGSAAFSGKRDDPDDPRRYKVVVNSEEQYSIWPAERENPLGWNDAGKTGSKGECLAYIKETWVNIQPLSLRRMMQAEQRNA